MCVCCSEVCVFPSTLALDLNWNKLIVTAETEPTSWVGQYKIRRCPRGKGLELEVEIK